VALVYCSKFRQQSAVNYDQKKNAQNSNLQKTSNFQIKQAPKQAIDNALKNLQIRKEISPKSWGNCKVGSTDVL